MVVIVVREEASKDEVRSYKERKNNKERRVGCSQNLRERQVLSFLTFPSTSEAVSISRVLFTSGCSTVSVAALSLTIVFLSDNFFFAVAGDDEDGLFCPSDATAVVVAAAVVVVVVVVAPVVAVAVAEGAVPEAPAAALLPTVAGFCSFAEEEEEGEEEAAAAAAAVFDFSVFKFFRSTPTSFFATIILASSGRTILP